MLPRRRRGHEVIRGEEVDPNSGIFWKDDGKHMKIMAMIESLVQRKVGMFDDLRNRAMGWHSLSLMLRPSGEETRIRRFYQHFLEPTQWLWLVNDDESPHVVNTGTMYDINWLHSCFSFAQLVPAFSFATLGKHSIIIMLNIWIFGYPFPLL